MRRLTGLVSTLLFAALGLHPSSGRAGSSFVVPRAHVPGQVEASFLINLFKFVTWPQAAQSVRDATICFLHTQDPHISDVQRRLQNALADHEGWTQLTGRTVNVRMLSGPGELTGENTAPTCQILYLDAAAAKQFNWPFQVPKSVLTVSNQRDFATSGGMIQFIWDTSDTYRIAIHVGNVKDSGLIVSGALGTLVDRVDDARFSR